MNVAFSAMLAFMLLIPGLFFLRVRRATHTHAALVTNAPQPFSVEIAMAIAIAIGVHVVCCALATFASFVAYTPPINLPAALMLLMGHFGKDEQDLPMAVKAVADYPVWIAGYFVLTMFVAGVAGKLSNCYDKKSAVAICLADHRELAMDEWAAFFNRGANTDALVTAVVEMGGKAYLFLGVLHQLHFDPTTAALDRIELVNVAKRPIEKPSGLAKDVVGQKWLWPEGADDAGESVEKYEQVFGNQFILRMSEIKTLNVVYLDQKISN